MCRWLKDYSSDKYNDEDRTDKQKSWTATKFEWFKQNVLKVQRKCVKGQPIHLE